MALKLIRELENLMQEALDKNASMFYLLPNEPPAFRINNEIVRGTSEPFTYGQIKDIAATAIGEEALKDIGTETGHLSTLCTLEGVADAIMVVAKTCGNYTISLRFQPTNLPTIQQARIPQPVLDAIMSQRGLVLFSGPTGCGKTTSLLVTLDYINSIKPCTISIVEHSVGYRLIGKKALVMHCEVGVDVPDMLTGISTSIPMADVLMIGELRNVEEIKWCIMASQNHFVLSQLHAITPETAIQRMIDIFPENEVKVPRKILAEQLQVVCAQTLLARADGNGQVATYGVLIPDDEMRKAIANGRDISDRKNPLPKDCRTIVEDIEQLHREGIINKDVADAAVKDFKH